MAIYTYHQNLSIPLHQHTDYLPNSITTIKGDNLFLLGFLVFEIDKELKRDWFNIESFWVLCQELFYNSIKVIGFFGLGKRGVRAAHSELRVSLFNTRRDDHGLQHDDREPLGCDGGDGW